jgi:hypothetical protein
VKSPEIPRRRSSLCLSERRGSLIRDLSHLRRTIRCMNAASPKIILERLKEEWFESPDASVYRELELEKQLWMLCALRGFQKKRFPPYHDSLVALGKGGSPAKVLSLYENQGQ